MGLLIPSKLAITGGFHQHLSLNLIYASISFENVRSNRVLFKSSVFHRQPAGLCAITSETELFDMAFNNCRGQNFEQNHLTQSKSQTGGAGEDIWVKLRRRGHMFRLHSSENVRCCEF